MKPNLIQLGDIAVDPTSIFAIEPCEVGAKNRSTIYFVVGSPTNSLISDLGVAEIMAMLNDTEKMQ